MVDRGSVATGVELVATCTDCGSVAIDGGSVVVGTWYGSEYFNVSLRMASLLKGIIPAFLKPFSPCRGSYFFQTSFIKEGKAFLVTGLLLRLV